MEVAETRIDQTQPVMTGQDRTGPVEQYTLTVDQASELYKQLGHERDPRSVRRFCQNNKLRCITTKTIFFTKAYAINRESVEEHVREIAKTEGRTEPVMTGQDRTGPVDVRLEIPTNSNDGQAAITADNSKYVALLEKINEQQSKELEIKNQQIASMLERNRESNILFQELQTRIAPRLAGGTSEPKAKINSPESTTSL
jgi:hypothetical protein